MNECRHEDRDLDGCGACDDRERIISAEIEGSRLERQAPAFWPVTASSLVSDKAVQ